MKIPTYIKRIPVLGYFARFPSMLIAMIVMVWISTRREVFDTIGVFFNVPALAFIVLVVATFMRHLFWRRTIDEFVADGGFSRGWEALSDMERTRWVLGVTLALIYCFSLIAAQLAK